MPTGICFQTPLRTRWRDSHRADACGEIDRGSYRVGILHTGSNSVARGEIQHESYLRGEQLPIRMSTSSVAPFATRSQQPIVERFRWCDYNHSSRGNHSRGNRRESESFEMGMWVAPYNLGERQSVFLSISRRGGGSSGHIGEPGGPRGSFRAPRQSGGGGGGGPGKATHLQPKSLTWSGFHDEG